MTGIIDIGSNTIRLVVYNNGEPVQNIGIRSDIINNTRDNNLSDEGMENLCKNLLFLISKAGCEEIYIIATEAIRTLSNKEDVKNRIFEKTGISIDILSGEEESECVFLGILEEIEESDGICADIGGGSIEIIVFEDEKIKFAQSYPLGCKKLKEEKDLEIIEKIKSQGSLYICGGTAKTLSKIKGKIIIKVEEIEETLEFVKNIPEENLRKMFPERYDTIEKGISIIKKIAEIYEKEEIHIIKNGVREGYLIKKR